jgi:hypothetical protein
MEATRATNFQPVSPVSLLWVKFDTQRNCKQSSFSSSVFMRNGVLVWRTPARTQKPALLVANSKEADRMLCGNESSGARAIAQGTAPFLPCIIHPHPTPPCMGGGGGRTNQGRRMEREREGKNCEAERTTSPASYIYILYGNVYNCGTAIYCDVYNCETDDVFPSAYCINAIWCRILYNNPTVYNIILITHRIIIVSRCDRTAGPRPSNNYI